MEAKESLRTLANKEAFERDMRFFELSSKCSNKREIESIFVNLLNQNELNRFEAG